MNFPLIPLIQTAGVGQLALVLEVLAIPGILGWREETARLRPLTRQVFWTYAGYIWATNLSFGLLSLLAAGSLVEGTVLAAAVTGFIAVYWGTRLALQFLVFDRSQAPNTWPVRMAEIALVTSFVAFTLIYTTAAVWNLRS